MFGRGSWAILGLAKDSLDAFKTSLEDRTLMLTSSQLAAAAIIRHFHAETVGINPFRTPRLDEDHPLLGAQEEELAQFATLPPEEYAGASLPPEILAGEGHAVTAQPFLLHQELPWFGLWAVTNELKDVGDLASIKEQRAYVLLERPYRFLQPTDKNTVDENTPGVTAAVRRQIPVLLDFHEGRVYVESSNKKVIAMIIGALGRLGAGILPVAWTYNRPNWPSTILDGLHENTQYRAEFNARAEDATRFGPNELERLEDREMESIVTRFFSMTQLPSDLWVGIAGPAQIRLHDTTPSIPIKTPATATTLLQITRQATISGGALTWQERGSVTTEKGNEFSFRKDLFCLALNDRINLTDVGAAMLRGFDLPTFRKDLQREIRKSGQVPSIEQFWSGWLHEMSNAVRIADGSFRELLDIDGKDVAGIAPLRITVNSETEVAA
ncbi:MAG: hypothetical protein ABI759_10390 [Candidatus Solibacter sp.]